MRHCNWVTTTSGLNLLLGLFADGDAIAAKVLVELGSNVDATRARMLNGR